MSRLPTIGNCPECGQQKDDDGEVSVFKHLGPLPSQNRRAEPSQGKISKSQKMKKIDTTDQGGALMDSATPKSAGFSGCVVWRKPRRNTCTC